MSSDLVGSLRTLYLRPFHLACVPHVMAADSFNHDFVIIFFFPDYYFQIITSLTACDSLDFQEALSGFLLFIWISLMDMRQSYQILLFVSSRYMSFGTS